MKKVKLKLDWFTKILLVLIASALWGLLLQPFFSPGEVRARMDIQDVNIVKIGGYPVRSADPIPVRVTNP